MNAGAKLVVFSGGLTASESKSYSLSTRGMLLAIHEHLKSFPSLESPPIEIGQKSRIGWISGELSIAKVVLKGIEQPKSPRTSEKKSPTETRVEKDAETMFNISDGRQTKLALITSSDYFFSGFAGLIRISDLVLDQFIFPVKALVRVLPATGSFGEWIAIPLVIHDANDA
jgi:hypothetical protein